MEAEKLCRSLEALNVSKTASTVNSGTAEAAALPTKKSTLLRRRTSNKLQGLGEEMVHLFNQIAESLHTAAARNHKDFATVLGVAVENLLFCCDDANANVRIAAEESLNRILQEHIDVHTVTVLVDLFKEIKKNGKARCVKAAWIRFAFFAHYIRPQRFRCRVFVTNLVPCILSLTCRDEEIIHEALAEGVPHIFKVLGCFVTEAEIKSLVKAFLSNLNSENSWKRRSASVCVVEICRHSKKPWIVVEWLLRGLLGMIRTSADNAPSVLFSGTLLAFKNLLNFMHEKRREEGEMPHKLSLDLQIQVMKILLDCCNHRDHNVQGFALEALHSFLRIPESLMRECLIAAGGLASYQNSPGESSCSSDFTLDFESTDSLSETTDKDQDVEDVLAENFGTIANPMLAKGISTDTSSELSDSVSIVSSAVSQDGLNQQTVDDEDFSSRENSPSDNRSETGTTDPEEKCDESIVSNELDDFDFTMIGSLYDTNNAPLEFIARFLCAKFLLKNGTAAQVKPGVRISLQCLALSCLSDAASLDASILMKSRLVLLDSPSLCLSISDAAVFLDHSDPLLKAHGAIFSSIVAVAVMQGRSLSPPFWNLQSFLSKTFLILREESAAATRVAVDALERCVLPFLSSSKNVKDSLYIIYGVVDILMDRKVSYWLLKTELMRFLRKIPLSYAMCAEDVYGKRKCSKSSVIEATLACLLQNLGDEDHRIRQTACENLAWLPYSCAFPRLASWKSFEGLEQNYEAFLKKQPSDLLHSMNTGLLFPYNVHELPRSFSAMEDSLSMIVGQLFDILICCMKKDTMNGLISTLRLLSRLYPPSVYYRSWFGIIEESDLVMEKYTSPAAGLLGRILENLMCNSSCADLQLHAHALELLGNLFSGLSMVVFVKTKTQSDGASGSHIGCFESRQFVDSLIRHLARLLNIIKAVQDGQKSTDGGSSLKTVISTPGSPGATTTILRRRQDSFRVPGKKVKNFDLKAAKMSLGTLNVSDMYTSLFDLVKKAASKHRTQLMKDLHTDKIKLLVNSTLVCLAQVLEMSTTESLSPHTEELVKYLRAMIDLDGRASVYCIEQLLRCLFGVNIGQMDSLIFMKDARTHFSACSPELELLLGFVEDSAFASDHGLFLPRFVTLPVDKNIRSSLFNADDWGHRWAHLLESRRKESLESLFANYSKEKRVIMSETIRQFESVVIKSLQSYTYTTEMGVQLQVLDLLVLLLQLHVNYNVLDGEHVFLKYILKQVDLVELGQIADSMVLLPYLFRFLIHLSHDKYIAQQNILTYGHIVQYCDSLMASGDQGQHRVFSVLNLLFEDASHRVPTATAPDERDAQLEVILSIALRCIPCPEAFEILRKFVLYQLTKSTETYETQARELVETTFLRMSPDTVVMRSFYDYDKIAAFLEIVGTQALADSPAFAQFFLKLTLLINQTASTNLAALGMFSAIVDRFVVSCAVSQFLQLFFVIDSNHPLEVPVIETPVEVLAERFVIVMSGVMDVFNSPDSNTELHNYFHCSILKSLTYFVQILEQGPVKSAVRDILSQKRVYSESSCQLPPVCKIAWMRFRYASTGCDFEPRSWNKEEAMFPIANHIAVTMWTFIRLSVNLLHLADNNAHSSPSSKSRELPFSGPEQSVRLLQDMMNDTVPELELELLELYYGRNATLAMQQLLTHARNQDGRDGRSLLLLFTQPGSLAVQLELEKDLSKMFQSDSLNKFSVFAADDTERIAGLWASQQSSSLKVAVFNLLGLPVAGGQLTGNLSTPGTMSDEFLQTWYQSLAYRVALSSTEDDAAGIARLLYAFDEETILTVLTAQKFSASILKSCFQNPSSGLTLDWQTSAAKVRPLFHAAKLILFQKIEVAWRSYGSSDGYQNDWMWLMLAGAFAEFGEKTNETEIEFPEDAMEDVIEFVLCLFKVLPSADHPHSLRRRALQCLEVCLENSSFVTWLRSSPQYVDIIVNAAFTVFEIEHPEVRILEEAAADSDQESLAPLFYRQITALTTWLEERKFLVDELVLNVILGLTRLPNVTEVIRIPPSAYRMGWKFEQGARGEPIPVDFLQDLPVLKDLVSRVCHYGWSTRRQFEETWMAFLSVLSSVPIDEETASDEALHENTVTNRIAAGRIALRCITALLLESVLAPFPGNPLRVQRASNATKSPHRQLDDFANSISSKTKIAVCEGQWVKQFIRKPHRPPYFHYTHFDGLDQPYCRWVMKGSPQPGNGSQVDLKSCLKFVMDLYSHWTSDEKLKKLSPYILDEVMKSTLHISNIFHDEKNFRWMYLFVRQVLRIKNIEESLFYGHLVDALGKALCVLDEDKEAMLTLKKAAESRAGQSLLNRICCARVVLRLIRQQTPGDSQKSLQWLMNLSTAIYEVECRSRLRCGDTLDLLFTVFVLEMDFFVPKAKESINPYCDVLMLELRKASSLTFPTLNNLVLILGRYLVDKRSGDGVFREQLTKAGLEVMLLSPPKSLAVLGFLLCCLDTGLKPNYNKMISLDDNCNSPSVMDSHSDPLFIMAMEKMTLVHQRIHKCFNVESEMLGDIFLTLLVDKMPLHEAVNRIMAEFQSCQPTSLCFIAELVAKVFGVLERNNLNGLIDEWISLSFCNFASRTPPAIGIWSLACLFCSSSPSCLTSLFPFLRHRSTVEDSALKEIFIIAGCRFFQDIETKETRQTFLDAVQTAAKSSDVMQIFLTNICSLKPS